MTESSTSTSATTINNSRAAELLDFIGNQIKLETDLQSPNLSVTMVNDQQQQQQQPMIMTNLAQQQQQQSCGQAVDQIIIPSVEQTITTPPPTATTTMITNNDQLNNNSKELNDNNDLNELSSSEKSIPNLVCNENNNNNLLTTATNLPLATNLPSNNLALNSSIIVPVENNQTLQSTINHQTNENTLIMDMNLSHHNHHHNPHTGHRTGHHPHPHHHLEFIDHHLQSTTTSLSSSTATQQSTAAAATVVDSNETNQSIQQQQITNGTNIQQQQQHNLYSMLSSTTPSASSTSSTQSASSSPTIIDPTATASSTTIMSFISNQNIMAPCIEQVSLTPSPSSISSSSSSSSANTLSSTSSSPSCSGGGGSISSNIIKQEELLDTLLLRGCNPLNVNQQSTNQQTVQIDQQQQCTSSVSSMGANLISDQQQQQLQYLNGTHFGAQLLGTNNTNATVQQSESFLQPDFNNQSNVSMQIVTGNQSSSSSSFVSSIDHPMINIKNENDSNLSPPQQQQQQTNSLVTNNNQITNNTTIDTTSLLPEISLQDLNKQLNAIVTQQSVAVVGGCPVPTQQPTTSSSIIEPATQSNIATNITMAMEGVLDGTYSSSSPSLTSTSTTNNFLVSNTNDNTNTNSPLIDQIMNTLNQTVTTTNVQSNPNQSIDSFMQTIPISSTNQDPLAITLACQSGNQQPSTIPCPMMTNDDCPPPPPLTTIHHQTQSAMTITEPNIVVTTTSCINPETLNILEQQQVANQMLNNNNNNIIAVNAIGNQLQNIAMSVDPTPTLSSNSTIINTNQISSPPLSSSTTKVDMLIGSGNLASYCHQDLTSTTSTTNNLSPQQQQLNNPESVNQLQQQQQVFGMTIMSNSTETANKSNELILPTPTSMITNQNQPPLMDHSLSNICTSTIISNNNNDTVLSATTSSSSTTTTTTNEQNDLMTSAQSNICPMSKMSDAELIVFIDPKTFD